MIDNLLQSGILPDAAIRIGIRRLLRQRLADESRPTETEQQQKLMDLVATLRSSPVAIETEAANQQHYELPARFFELCLGPNLKYSCAWYGDGARSLGDAEVAMLDLYLDRAELTDGQDILELGCGWGSLTVHMARRFPASRITALSNSHSQRAHILARCQAAGLTNVEVVTADVNHFETDRRFDRVVSVEMFEHMRNYATLFGRIHGWLREGGKLFVHIFTHRDMPYLFEPEGEDDWMARYFFTGGIMPSNALLLHFDEGFRLDHQWLVDGTHYEQTAEAWLANMDAHKAEIMPLMAETYGPDQAQRWWVYWRVFYMACAELWGFADGREWMVSHYRWTRL